MDRRAASKWLRLLAGMVVVAAMHPAASAGTPSWLQQLRAEPTPAYADNPSAVMLLNERFITVTGQGEVKVMVRRAYRILRPEGKSYGIVSAHFDDETRLTYFKAWSISSAGVEYESKEKDAVETQPFADEIYSDSRLKILRPPAQVGSVVGYEAEQKGRPSIMEDLWAFQDEIPVRVARYTLELPGDWEPEVYWLNHVSQPPTPSGKNRWTWEVRNLDPIESESNMPAWRSMAGYLGVKFRTGSANSSAAAKLQVKTTWNDVGKWYSGIAADQRTLTPEIRQKVQQLTAGLPATLQKIRRLAAFVQSIRYVAVEIGIGGFRPHAADRIMAAGYGDCKDKATLLSAMLRELNVDSYYVLANAERDVVMPGFPTVLGFNHVFLAIRLPAEAADTALYAQVTHDRLGKLLLFDPTQSYTPLGQLIPSSQGSYVLLVDGDNGDLLKTPLLPAAANSVVRTGKAVLSPAGTLTGVIDEIRSGLAAATTRQQLLHSTTSERTKILEDNWAALLDRSRLKSATVDHLEETDGPVSVHYEFVADNYAQRSGSLLLVKPRIAGRSATSIEEAAKRKHPIEFASTGITQESFEISLPQGFEIDEPVAPRSLENVLGKYEQRSEQSGNVLRYTRRFEMNDVRVPLGKVIETKKFFQGIAEDERSAAVLKPVRP